MYDGYLKRMYEKEGLLKNDFEKKVNLYIKKYVDTFKHEAKDIVYVGCTKLSGVLFHIVKCLMNMH